MPASLRMSLRDIETVVAGAKRHGSTHGGILWNRRHRVAGDGGC